MDIAYIDKSMLLDVKRVEFYKWEVGAIQKELRELRVGVDGYPVPVIKLPNKLQQLDRIKDLEQREKALTNYLESCVKIDVSPVLSGKGTDSI